MPVEHIHTYLVHPKTPDGPSQIHAASVPLEGKLFALLSDVYRKADHECDIDISFNPRPDGSQENPVRDLVVAHLGGPTLDTGRRIAEKLEAATTHRSGLGLLFLVVGKEDRERKFVLSRFPADSAIMAQEAETGLTVAFLERVFMKSAFSYKAAAYRGASLTSDFWQGRAIDKQIGNPLVRASEYWIKGFLDSDFLTTSAAGTRRLALAIRDAVRESGDLGVKQELTAAATLATALDGQTVSIADFQQRYGLSEQAIEQMDRHLKQPGVSAQQFRFDRSEFAQQVAYRSVELDSGATLTAEAGDFDRVFSQEIIDRDEGTVRISAEGIVVNEKLRKSAL